MYVCVCVCVDTHQEKKIYIQKNNVNCLQGPVYSLHMGDDGFASGGKDSCVKMWDADFKPVVSVNLANVPDGYKGK